MAPKWDAAKHERMLLLIIENFNIDHNLLVQAWAKKHGKDDAPTVGGIQQHMNKVKKKAGSGKTQSIAAPATNGSSSTPKKVPATPKKQTMATTPNTSAKRDHSAMSEDDDSETDMEALKRAKNGTKRRSLSRSSKVQKKPYSEDSDDDREAGDEADLETTGANDDSISDIFKNEMSFDGASESEQGKVKSNDNEFRFGAAARKAISGAARNGTPKKRARYSVLGEDSDVSNFSDGFN